MKRVLGNISKGKKIAGLVVLCLAVVLGYFGYHRLVVHADPYVHHGVINKIEDLPKDIYADEGTDANPFLILELVPSAADASIGYMVDGCAPVQFDNLESNAQVIHKYANIGCYTTAVFDEEFEDFEDYFEATTEEKKAAFPGYNTKKGWQRRSDPQNVTIYGYYEKVGKGEGYFIYDGNEQDATDKSKYAPHFKNVGKGNGDFRWVSCASSDVYNNCSAVFEAARNLENKARLTSQSDSFTFEKGDREYTTRSGNTHYYWSGTYRGVHLNSFLRVSLGQSAGCYTYGQVKNFCVVVKTIEPRELKDHPEWIDYADLIYMSTSGSTMQSNWDTYPHLVEWYQGVETKRTEDFSAVEDFSWSVARKLFMKVNALEEYDGNGDFRFAPIILTSEAKSQINCNTAPAGTKTDLLDYSIMKSVENHMTRTDGSDNNIWKFMVMDLSMNQERFYDLFFKSKYKEDNGDMLTVITEERDQNGNEVGICRAQANDNAKRYWTYNTFMPIALNYDVPKEKQYEAIDYYGIHQELVLGKRGDQVIDGGSGNVGLSGATFMFNSDNLIAQLSNTGSIPKTDATKDAFDWFKEEYGIDLPSLSVTQMIEYLLNYKKKGNSDDDERDRAKIPIRILEIEPCNDFIWKDTKDDENSNLVADFFPSSRFNVTVDCMTTQEFNGVKTDLSSEYDIIYIGMTTGKFNTTTAPNANLEFGQVDYVDYNDASFNTSNGYKLVGKVYLHVGDLVKAASGKKLRFSGNDISSLKRQELQDFVKTGGDTGTGILILEDTLKDFKTPKFTRKVDSASYLTVLLDKINNRSNVEAYKNLKNKYMNLLNMMKETGMAYKRSQMEIIGTPPEYVKKNSDSKAASGSSIQEVTGDEGHSYQVLNSSVLNFSFNINELEKVQMSKKLGISITNDEIEEINKKTFGIKLYMDIDYDGVITDTDEKSELVYDSVSADKGGAKYGMPSTYTKNGATYTFSFDFAKVYEDRKLAARKNGALTWRFVLYDIDDNSYCISKTGTSYYRGSSEPMEIRFYQIVADQAALGSALNLTEQSKLDGSLFNKYTKNLNDYKISADSQTVTLDDYIQKYNQDVATATNEQDKMAVFQNYDMIIVSCSNQMQTKAKDHAEAIEFIKKLADSGVSVLYTTQSVSRDKVEDAADTSDNMRSMLNQRRFDLTGTYYDTPGYSAGAKTNPGKLATTSNYRPAQVQLEYTYKAVMQTGDDSDDNGKMCFNNNKWSGNNVKYGIGNNGVKTNKITNVNEGKLSLYPYQIEMDKNTKQMNIVSTAAQDYQLNMNNPNMTVWYCLGGNDDTLYGISPNDATNNYYLYTVGNVAYTSADLANMGAGSDMEMKLFVNTLIASYEVSSAYPHVIVNAVRGISSSNKDAQVTASNKFTNTESTLYFDAIMPEMKKQYLDYIPNATPIVVGTTAPVSQTLEPAETMEPDETVAPENLGVSGGVQQATPTPVPTEAPTPTPEATVGPIKISLDIKEIAGNAKTCICCGTVNNIYNSNEVMYSDSVETDKLKNLSDNAVLYFTFTVNKNLGWVPGSSMWNVYIYSGKDKIELGSVGYPNGQDQKNTYILKISDVKKKLREVLGEDKDITGIALSLADATVPVEAYIDPGKPDPAPTPEPGEEGGNDEPLVIPSPTPKPTLDSNKYSKVADTDDNSYVPTGRDYTHKVYFTPFDNNSPGGNIHSLRISLVDKATSATTTDDVYALIGKIYHIDVTGKVFELKASQDGTFTVAKRNYTKDSQEYFFLYKEKYMLTNFNYVKFEIENAKKSGTTYLYPYNQVKGDNTYMFELD